MVFEDKELNYKKTKRNVERAINQYYKSLTRIATSHQPKITQSFSLSMSAPTGAFYSKTENAALSLMDSDDLAYVQKVVNVVNSLNDEYRKILIQSYFRKIPNDLLADKMTIGVATLLRKKREAIELFAYGMDIVVYCK